MNLTITDDEGSKNTTTAEISVLEIVKEKTKTNGFISGYEAVFLVATIISIVCIKIRRKIK
jgi:hypothetical protein